MRVWGVGGGGGGARVLRQLQKNPQIVVMTVDANEDPYAVQKGLIEAVDIHEVLTPLTLDYIMQQSLPDLVLITTATEDLGLGKAPGIDILAEALREEITAICEAPVIEVARTGL